MRRAGYPRRHGQNPFLIVGLIMLIMSGTGGVVMLSAMATVVAMTFAPVVAVMLGVGMIHLVTRPRPHRRRVPAYAHPGVMPVATHGHPATHRYVPPPPRPELEWSNARIRFHALRAQYAAFECDTMEVLRLPALADVRVPSTARFVDAFAEAQALETDAFPPLHHALSFEQSVDRAERGWQAARDAAERIRLSGLSTDERHTVERVVKLLTTARDSDSEAERLAAYALARTELTRLDSTGVIHIPRSAKGALGMAGRGQLPA